MKKESLKMSKNSVKIRGRWKVFLDGLGILATQAISNLYALAVNFSFWINKRLMGEKFGSALSLYTAVMSVTPSRLQKSCRGCFDKTEHC